MENVHFYTEDSELEQDVVQNKKVRRGKRDSTGHKLEKSSTTASLSTQGSEELTLDDSDFEETKVDDDERPIQEVIAIEIT